MNGLWKKLCLATAVGLGLNVFVGVVSAGVPPPPPPLKGICHNIGGPRELGANCDQAGQCVLQLPSGDTLAMTGKQFLGIIINASEQATAAHIAHGDGPILAVFNPPLHLASEIGPHKASNVECLGERVLDQPPEPGN